MVKEELTSEEKFFERSVITEKFVKKYKNPIVGLVIVIILAVGANMAYDMNKESTAIAANETLSELQKDASNTQVLSRLKSLSPNLYDAYIYSRAIADKDIQALENIKNSKSAILSDLATYESLQNTKDVSKFNNYALKQNAIYKDLARVQSAIILMNEGNTDKAHAKLLSISDSSSLAKVAKALLHYGVK